MRKLLPVLGLMIVCCLNSCLVSKKVVYFNDLTPEISQNVLPIPPLKIQKNDRLSIEVSARNPELAVPFNSTAGVYKVDDKGLSEVNVIDKGYLVDALGNIDFPVIGTLNVEGMTLDGLRDFLLDKLKKENLINTPVVKVELLNLKVIVLGEGNNAIINAPDGRLTILEAISKAGGIGFNVAANKIAVIREEAGVRKIYYNDIETKEIFNSPTYYLQQNDILYLEPLAGTSRGDEARTWRIISLITSIATLGVTTWAILTRD